MNMDSFLSNYESTDLRIAAEFLSNWLPYLSAGLCNSCTQILSDRVRSINHKEDPAVLTPPIIECNEKESSCSTHSVRRRNDRDNELNNVNEDTHSIGSWKDEADEHVAESSPTSEIFNSSAPSASPSIKQSWADMAQEDEVAREEDNEVNSKVLSVNDSIEEGTPTPLNVANKPKIELSRDQREHIRFRSVKRQKDFRCFEKVKGRLVNVLEGLELHEGVFSAAEQKRIVNHVEELQEMGRKGLLQARTYTAPQKWMRGKGRVTLQFGCCYNYALDKNGNEPGIMKNETVDPLPHLFKVMIKRLIRWHVLPPSSVPDSCIVNIYEEDDCIPPHIDNHDFLRPFCTVSFLSQCKILFGSNLKVVRAGEFDGSFAIPLPVGSVLVLNGNGADVAKHCVPAVPTKRISITFRKMDVSKWPIGFVPEADLQGLEPLSDEAEDSMNNSDSNNNNTNNNISNGSASRSDSWRREARGRGGYSSRFGARGSPSFLDRTR